MEVENPVPKNNEVLIKIFATTVSSADCRMRSFKVPRSLWIPARIALGISKPRKPILGLYLSGDIESVGKSVNHFQKGDKIFARVGKNFGAYAEDICLPKDCLIALKPSNLSYEEAVSVPFGGFTALYFLKKAKIQSGQKILIYGASGATGTSAVQLAKFFGAEVTGVCSSMNLELVKSLGADKVIDYTKEDFTMNNGHFDIIFDTVGKITYSKSKKALHPNGKYVSVLTSGHADMNTPDLIFLKELVETGKLKPVIDRIYNIDQIVEAHRYVDKGHKKGNVVINITH